MPVSTPGLQEDGNVGVAFEKGDENRNLHHVALRFHPYSAVSVSEPPPREVDSRIERPHLPERIRCYESGRCAGVTPDVVPAVVLDAVRNDQPVGGRMEIACGDSELPSAASVLRRRGRESGRFCGVGRQGNGDGGRRLRLRKLFEYELRFLCLCARTGQQEGRDCGEGSFHVRVVVRPSAPDVGFSVAYGF